MSKPISVPLSWFRANGIVGVTAEQLSVRGGPPPLEPKVSYETLVTFARDFDELCRRHGVSVEADDVGPEAGRLKLYPDANGGAAGMAIDAGGGFSPTAHERVIVSPDGRLLTP